MVDPRHIYAGRGTDIVKERGYGNPHKIDSTTSRAQVIAKYEATLKSYPHWANFGEFWRILAKTVQWGWGEFWRKLANFGEFWRKVFWLAKKDSPKFASAGQSIQV